MPVPTTTSEPGIDRAAGGFAAGLLLFASCLTAALFRPALLSAALHFCGAFLSALPFGAMAAVAAHRGHVVDRRRPQRAAKAPGVAGEQRGSFVAAQSRGRQFAGGVRPIPLHPFRIRRET